MFTPTTKTLNANRFFRPIPVPVQGHLQRKTILSIGLPTSKQFIRLERADLQMVIILYQYPTLSTIQGTRWSETPHLLVPKPASFSRFFVGHSFHQARILTTDTKQGCQHDSHDWKVNISYPDGLRNQDQNAYKRQGITEIHFPIDTFSSLSLSLPFISTYQRRILTDDDKIGHCSRNSQYQRNRHKTTKGPARARNDNGRPIVSFAQDKHIAKSTSQATKKSMKVFGSPIMFCTITFPSCGHRISERIVRTRDHFKIQGSKRAKQAR
jgi:hypothetical protein